MFTAFIARFNRLDILVNNPYAGSGATFLEITEENWDLTLDVCLKGFFLCSQQAARIMVQQGEGGCIVSTSSVHAYRAWPDDTAYGVAKAGVLRLTESMAVDLGPHNIRCNAVMPGHMDLTHVFDTQAPVCGQRVRQSQSQYTPCSAEAPLRTSDEPLPFSARQRPVILPAPPYRWMAVF